jgi:hypothetical protein
MFGKFFKKRENEESQLDEFVGSNQHFEVVVESAVKYIVINPSVNRSDLDSLLDLLWSEGFEIAFHDTIHPTISDPGAYFSYSTYKSSGKSVWSMTYGNHGWSGGIYHINSNTVSHQILNLIQHKKMDRIQITGVIFFSQYELENTQKSKAKDLEIQQIHE